MNAIHFKHWSGIDKVMLGHAGNFQDLARLAMSIIRRIPVDIEMVSGPISTGGVGTIDGNRKVFEAVIEILILEDGLNVFSQMPFEDKMVEFYKKWHAENPLEKYCMPILHDFYEPVFSSGRVKALHFIDGWESSFGAKWEHGNCSKWGIKRKYLSRELSQRALAQSSTNFTTDHENAQTCR